MRYRSSSSDTNTVVYIVMLVVAVIFMIWFYSADASGTGWISSKWVETNTSCDDDGCTTTHTYYVQFTDTRVYTVFWGTLHWDRMMENSQIAFQARGRRIGFFGWRWMVPAIFDFQQLTAAPTHP